MATWRPPFFPDPFSAEPGLAKLRRNSRDFCALHNFVASRHTAIATVIRRPGSQAPRPLRTPGKRLRRDEQIVTQRRPSLVAHDRGARRGKSRARFRSERHGRLRRRAEMLGDVAPGERLVAPDPVSRALELVSRRLDHEGAALAPKRSPSTISRPPTSAALLGIEWQSISTAFPNSARARDQRSTAHDRAGTGLDPARPSSTGIGCR